MKPAWTLPVTYRQTPAATGTMGGGSGGDEGAMTKAGQDVAHKYNRCVGRTGRGHENGGHPVDSWGCRRGCVCVCGSTQIDPVYV